MELTLNEMRALKRLAESALADKEHTAEINKNPEVKERWDMLEKYLKAYKIGVGYESDCWVFLGEEQIKSLLFRLNDLIEDEERHRKDASRMAYASWLSAVAAALSALAALAAFCSRFL